MSILLDKKNNFLTIMNNLSIVLEILLQEYFRESKIQMRSVAGDS
jgi:hypothetical protein